MLQLLPGHILDQNSYVVDPRTKTLRKRVKHLRDHFDETFSSQDLCLQFRFWKPQPDYRLRRPCQWREEGSRTIEVTPPH